MATNFLADLLATPDLASPNMAGIQQGLGQIVPSRAPDVRAGGGFINRLGDMLSGRAGAQQSYGGGGFWDTVGRLSDMVSSTRGAPQSYAMGMQARDARRQQQAAQERGTAFRNALGRWAMNPEDMEAWAEAVRADPEAALGIRKEVRGEAPKPPTSYQEYLAAAQDPAGYGAYLESRQPFPVIGDLNSGIIAHPGYRPFSFARRGAPQEAQTDAAPQMTVTPQQLNDLVVRYGPEAVQRQLDNGALAVGGR